MEQIIQLNSGAKLSPHFTLGELTKTSHNVYNIPSHEAIENLKRVCGWLEVLRERYSCITNAAEHRGRITNAAEHGVVINSGYRSPQLNKKVGGAVNSNHLTGCAVDIRVSGQEQLIIYAAILIEYANETHQDFDELLLERNRHGAIWLHFAVRPKDNRRHVMFLRT
ncbi:MAG: hypothetical protein IJQ64_00465 [Prevotella sp.]|nr:hypothetical protein [Prevotella sp.]